MSYYGNYTVKSEGTNSQGNHYRALDYGPNAPNQNAYDYHNVDRSRFSSNPDGSQYFDNARGTETYKTPDGTKFISRHGSLWELVPGEQ
ncbi:hypothetical protein F4678DRAFT_484870 [Xylaria arbuscula]|nr:hypothetical protein F4678DRAFT_484870 [Xylaria arbuscula]